jgi:hypothetical protein
MERPIVVRKRREKARRQNAAPQWDLLDLDLPPNNNGCIAEFERIIIFLCGVQTDESAIAKP